MIPSTESKDDGRAWRKIVAKYEAPSLARSLAQVANTLVPYFAILYVMYLALDVSYWITLGLAIPAAGFLTRSFIIAHDCGHGSFFKGKKANRTLGFVAALLTLLPSYYWSREHAKHHATAGDLDQRGAGDIWTLTVQEYLALPRRQQIWYRVYRNPFFLFGVGPLFVFFVNYRYWRPGDNKRARWSTMKTNIALVVIVTLACGIAH